MTRAMSVIDDCINKLKIRGKHKGKWSWRKAYSSKKWSGARRPDGPATTALIDKWLGFLWALILMLSGMKILSRFQQSEPSHMANALSGSSLPGCGTPFQMTWGKLQNLPNFGAKFAPGRARDADVPSVAAREVSQHVSWFTVIFLFLVGSHVILKCLVYLLYFFFCCRISFLPIIA